MSRGKKPGSIAKIIEIKDSKCEKEWKKKDIQEVGLETVIFERKRNSSL